MLGLTLSKTHRRILDAREETRASMEASLHDTLVKQSNIIAAQNEVLQSTERNKVLADLEEALNLIEAYQRALTIVSAADPNIRRANTFLEKFNKKGESSATYLGALRNGDWNETMGTPPPLPRGRTYPSKHFEGPTPEVENRWKQEEEEWGDEAYGTAHVRIEAEAVDEGDVKEEGYTRARIRFADVDAPEPVGLEAAKRTTEEASK